MYLKTKFDAYLFSLDVYRVSILETSKLLNQNVFSCLYFRSRLCKNTKLDLHTNLKETLTTAYLAGSMNGGGNFRRWKNYLTRYCRFTRHEFTTIRRDFVYLEKNGLLSVGDYNFLIKMFEHIDKRAIPLIKKTALKIKEAPIVRHKTGFIYNFKI